MLNMPVPETAKWEAMILHKTIEETKRNLTIAILVCNSLGKSALQKHLEEIRSQVEPITL
jgi:predicted alpha/beta hydrolase family esterase